MANLRDEILSSCEAALPIEKVSTPEWGGSGHVYVRSLRADEADKAVAVFAKGGNNGQAESGAIVGLCILCVCDSEGNALFDTGDVAALSRGPLAPIRRCGERAIELNGLTDAASEELAGNSDGQGEDSDSG